MLGKSSGFSRNQICLINPDGSGQQQLTSQGNNEDPAWSPDGKSILAVANLGLHSEILHIDPTTRKATPLTDGRHFIQRDGPNFAADDR